MEHVFSFYFWHCLFVIVGAAGGIALVLYGAAARMRIFATATYKKAREIELETEVTIGILSLIAIGGWFGFIMLLLIQRVVMIWYPHVR